MKAGRHEVLAMNRTGSGKDVTRLLLRARDGESEALDDLLPVVYDELREMARRQLRRERSDHTLETVALVHEAYIKLVKGSEPEWRDRAHFYGVAARCMRQVLVDHARARSAEKRGGAWARTSLTNKGLGVSVPLAEILALDEALERLGALDERLQRVVELRFFAGLEEREVAAVLGVTTRTVQRDWARARAWLNDALYGGHEAEEGDA